MSKMPFSNDSKKVKQGTSQESGFLAQNPGCLYGEGNPTLF